MHTLLASMPPSTSTSYRVSTPLPVVSNPAATSASLQFVYKQWTAWSHLPGREHSHKDGGRRPWAEVLRACRAFHADLGKLAVQTKPEFLHRRMNRFREADAVAWGDKRLDQVPLLSTGEVHTRTAEPIRKLVALKRDFTALSPSQLVHGDITGNMLFDEHRKLPPGIIDLTFYWRPAAFGAAIVVADGLMWEGEGEELIEMYGTDGDSIQMLVRAVLFRTLTWAIDVPVIGEEEDREFMRIMLPRVDFNRPIEMIHKYIK
ncbi:hypothetical protein NQ176_g5584 [Zarea fungicola]|uniref:Uncharacterized protein n=1 Tax=Zarea fungicola TaxID=93591 RepID=A0ACC1N7R0_9HYPO|nr:hypothetical protein NQ176_g5584 [Lecanicillium fungicola]